MQVKTKNFKVEVEIKNKGMELEIRSTKNEFLGDMVINRTGMIWCAGKTSSKNGIQKTWEEIIDWFCHNSEGE